MRVFTLLFVTAMLTSACLAQPSVGQMTATASLGWDLQISQAQKDIEAGNFDLARQRLEYILERDPNNPDVLQKLSELPSATPTPGSPESATARAVARIETARALRTPSPTAPQTTPASIPASLPATQKSVPFLLGTSLPFPAGPIGIGNYQQLSYTGLWGRGNILGVAFAPDGHSFVVGSAFGIAIYDMRKLQSEPTWILFNSPFVYESLFFSEDGRYILLEMGINRQVRQYPDGHVVKAPADVKWQKNSKLLSYSDEEALSGDGTRRLASTITHDEEYWDIEFSIRRVFDVASGQFLFELSDETMYVTYNDRTEPQGCDLHSFSYCGNAYSPASMIPYRVAFSPVGDTLTILYRAWNLWYSNRYSVLRVYNANNGRFLNHIGNYQNPIETFAYGPNGHILLGYVNGAIELWSPGGQSKIYGAWHFNTPIESISSTKDSKYIYIQRQGNLEVRRASDGALYKRYAASMYALSPVENLVAIADLEGNIRLQYLNGKSQDLSIPAHKSRIYALEFSPDGKMLVSAGADCAIRAWDVQTGKFLHPFERTIVNAYEEDFTASRIYIKHFRFIPGTNQILGFGSWGTVVSWNMHSGATNYVTTSQPLEYYQGMITLNPHFPEFFTVDLPKNVFYINHTAYDLNTGEPQDNPQPKVKTEPGCAPAGPVSNDGKIMFSIGYDEREGQICVLDAADYRLLDSIIIIPPASIFEGTPPYHLINWVFLSPDGNQLMVETVSGAILMYQINP